MTDSRRCPIAACAEHHTAPASGPRQIIVAVIASIAARCPRRSRPKSTHPVIPHMFLVLRPPASSPASAGAPRRRAVPIRAASLGFLLGFVFGFLVYLVRGAGVPPAVVVCAWTVRDRQRGCQAAGLRRAC